METTYNKVYYKINREKIKEYCKEYYQKNKEKIKVVHRNYYLRNKEKNLSLNNEKKGMQ